LKNDYLTGQAVDVNNRLHFYLDKMSITGSQDIIDAISCFQMGVAKAVNCVASSILHDTIIDEKAAGAELRKGDIVVFGLKREDSSDPSFIQGSGAIISDKLDLGNGKSLIEITDPKGSRLATPWHFGIGNETTSVAIARAKTTTAKRERAAKHAKELSKTIKKDRIFKDHESPMEG
jgi:hypothetical protein